MSYTYFISNLPETIDIENLYLLFLTMGEINRFKVIQKRRYNRTWVYAFVQLTQANESFLRHFNGYDYEGKRLAATCVKPLAPLPLTTEVQSLIETISLRLMEEKPEAIKHIELLVTWCGVEFARALLEETLTVEANGGLTVIDKSRRRSVGGVFFYLSKPRIYWPLLEKIYPQLKKPRSISPPKIEIPDEIYTAFAALQEAELALQTQILQMKGSGAVSGMFSKTKQLAEVKQKIAHLKYQYPDL